MGGHSYHSNYHHGGGHRINYSSGGGGDCGCDGRVVKYGWLIGITVFCIILYLVIAGPTYPKSKNQQVDLSLSETRIYSFSSTWYEKVSFTTFNYKDITNNGSLGKDIAPPSSVQLLRFKNRPPLTKSDSWVLTEPSVFVGNYDHYYWSWYFYKGSTMTVSWNFSMPITAYLLRSQKGYSSYFNDDGYTYSYTIQQKKIAIGSMTFKATKDDIYFVVFENWDSPRDATGSSNFNITSTLLDVSNPVSNCSFPCTMEVGYKSNDVFVLNTPSVQYFQALGIGSPNSEFNLRMHLDSRTAFVGLVLFMIPMLIMVSLLVCLVLMCKREDIASAFGKVGSSRSTVAQNPLTSVEISMPSSSTPGGGAVVASPYPAPAPFTPDPYPTATPYPPNATPTMPDATPYPPPLDVPPTAYPAGEAPPPGSGIQYPPATAYTPVPYGQPGPDYTQPQAAYPAPIEYPPPTNPEYPEPSAPGVSSYSINNPFATPETTPATSPEFPPPAANHPL